MTWTTSMVSDLACRQESSADEKAAALGFSLSYCDEERKVLMIAASVYGRCSVGSHLRSH